MTADEAEKRIRAYIRPARKDIAVFVVSGLVMVAVIIILSTAVIILSPEDILNKTFVLIDLETRHAEIGGGILVIAAAAVALLACYTLFSRWADVVSAGCSVDETLMLIDINGELTAAAAELQDSVDRDRHIVITEHYVFGENTGCAARKRDILDYTTKIKRRSPGSSKAEKDIWIKLTDGKWYVLGSSKVQYDHAPEKELDALLTGNNSIIEPGKRDPPKWMI